MDCVGDPGALSGVTLSNSIHHILACLKYCKQRSELGGTGVLTIAGLIGNCALLPLAGVGTELYLVALGQSAAAEFLGGVADAETFSL